MASAHRKYQNYINIMGRVQTPSPPPPEHLKYGIRSVHVISFTSQAIGLQLDILINNLFYSI